MAHSALLAPSSLFLSCGSIVLYIAPGADLGNLAYEQSHVLAIQAAVYRGRITTETDDRRVRIPILRRISNFVPNTVANMERPRSTFLLIKSTESNCLGCVTALLLDRGEISSFGRIFHLLRVAFQKRNIGAGSFARSGNWGRDERNDSICNFWFGNAILCDK